MRAFLRANGACLLFALGGCLALAWLGLYGFGWTDYEVEAQSAVQALAAGHFGDFLRLAPAYGGSLLERAPFALLPGLWGGGPLAVYRALAAPCLLATAALAVWLVADLRARGASRLARGVALGVCVANPMTLRGLEIGHPEDALGGVLCVAAVLIAAHSAAGRERRREALLAGLLAGLAFANKEWALVAVGPVLLALPPRRRALALAGFAAAAGAVLAPLLLGSAGSFAAASRASASSSSAIFQPWQVWWFLGHHGATVHGLFGSVKPGFRSAPAWIGAVSHPAVIAAGGLVALSLYPRARKSALGASQALLALCFVLLLRCLLDTWDVSYYTVPFLLALLAWETRRPDGMAPLALAATSLCWLTFTYLGEHAPGDTQAAAFLAWALPLAGLLAVRLYRPQRSGARPRSSAGEERRQETTVSSFGRLVSTS